MGKKTTIASLNDDVLLLVLGNLPAPERARARQVCRRWAALLGGPRAWADVATNAKAAILLAVSRRGTIAITQRVALRLGLKADTDADKCIIRDVMWKACWEGNLRVAQWLADAFDLRDKGRPPAIPANFLADMCQIGSRRAVEWLLGQFSPPKHQSSEVHLAFRAACCRGHLPLARRLLERFAMGQRDAWRPSSPDPIAWGPNAVISDFGQAFESACYGGHLNVARWIIGHVGAANIPYYSYESAFTSLCARGRLADVRWLVKTATLPTLGHRSRSWWHEGFLAACRRDRLRVVAWIFENFDPQKEATLLDNAFCAACEPSRLDLAQRLAGHLKPGSFEAAASISRALRGACYQGKLKTAQWLVATFGLAEDQVTMANAFKAACTEGHLRVARWLADRSRLDAASVRVVRPAGAAVDDPLVGACANGYLKMAQWLVSRFDPADVSRLWSDEIVWLRSACEGGYLAVARWLADHYNMNADVVKADKAIWNAIIDADWAPEEHVVLLNWRTSLQALEWFIVRFGVTAEDVRGNDGVLQAACVQGILPVVQRLMGLGLTARDLHVPGKDAFLAACAEGSLEVAQWLVAEFGPGAAVGTQANLIDAYRAAEEEEDTDVTQWLTDRFGVTCRSRGSGLGFEYLVAGGRT